MEIREPIGREMRFRLAAKVFAVVCKFCRDQRSTKRKMKMSGRVDEIDLDHLRSWLAELRFKKIMKIASATMF